MMNDNLPRLRLDPSRFPISRLGSNFCFLDEIDPDDGCPFGPGLYLRDVRRSQTAPRELYKLDLFRNGELRSSLGLQAFPGGIHLIAEDGGEVCMALDKEDESEQVRFFATGTGLCLRAPISSYVHAIQVAADRFVVVFFEANMRMSVRVIEGNGVLDAPWGSHECDHITLMVEPDDSGRVELALEPFTTVWESRPLRSRETILADLDNEFQEFLQAFPGTSQDEWQEAYALSAYVCWANTVRKQGQLRRPAIFMSKHRMSQVWSWDNCFNAMALCDSHPQLAWDQFMVIADHQDQYGAFPDSVSKQSVQWSFCKAPVYGYAYRYCLEKNQSCFGEKERLEKMYAIIAKNTSWWLDHRRLPGRELPYLSHGNDGFDTSTMFLGGCPLEGPDVAAYLADQCHSLATFAEELGKHDEALDWKARAEILIRALVAELWDAEEQRFISLTHEGKKVSCDSSQMLIPLILGACLPDYILKPLLRQVESFETGNGIASELPSSPYYEPDGHCRGPVWAPPTFFIARACRNLHQHDLARRIEDGFCQAVAKGGCAECFDALAGTPLREIAYSWTANVFIIFQKAR